MNSKEFKKIFDEVAKSNKFEKAFGGWFKESNECIVSLYLQKSNFGDYYELNINIFIQGMFGNTYVKSKDLVSKQIGDIFTRQPQEYKDIFDFDITMEDSVRVARLDELFKTYIVPITDKTLFRIGILELADNSGLFLLPAVRDELRLGK